MVMFFSGDKYFLFSKRLAFCLCLLVIALLLSGCETRIVSSTWDNYFPKKAMGNENVVKKASNILKYLPHRNRVWTVRLATFSDKHRSWRAALLINFLHKNYDFKDVFIYGRRGTLQVMVGKFKKRSSAKLKKLLHKVRSISNKSGKHPFWGARIYSLIINDKTYADPLNLRAYHDGYTLQIGFYNGPNNRKNAVEAVKSLRKDGARAYYYFGKTKSMITVGLFTKEQAFVTKRAKISPSKSWIQAYSPAVRALQKKFPYNLGNGKTIKQSVDGKDAGTQSSFLVQTPE